MKEIPKMCPGSTAVRTLVIWTYSFWFIYSSVDLVISESHLEYSLALLDHIFPTFICFLSKVVPFFLFFFWPHLAACRNSVPQPGVEPGPQQWKPRVLTTRSRWPLVFVCWKYLWGKLQASLQHGHPPCGFSAVGECGILCQGKLCEDWEVLPCGVLTKNIWILPVDLRDAGPSFPANGKMSKVTISVFVMISSSLPWMMSNPSSFLY